MYTFSDASHSSRDWIGVEFSQKLVNLLVGKVGSWLHGRGR